MFLCFAITGLIFTLTHGTDSLFAGISGTPKMGPDDASNAPFGKAMGVNPGRVIWAWDPKATNENCQSRFETQDWYFKPENTNSEVVRKMVQNSIGKLTGKSGLKESWDILFHYHNLRKSNKDAGYAKGEKILIKINQGTSRLGLTPEEKENGFYYPKTLKDR